MKKLMHAIAYGTLFSFIVLLDFLTKQWAFKTLTQSVQLNGFFSCELVINRGISWGLFHQAQGPFYLTLSAVISLLIGLLAVYTIIRFSRGYQVFCETMVLAGACGNLLDRFLYGGVVDFLVLSYGAFALPVFNVADATIICGAFCLILLHYE